MGSDQSSLSEGALSSVRRFKQDASKLSTSRPIGEGKTEGLPSSRSQTFRTLATTTTTQTSRWANTGPVPKHNIVVVADGSVAIKDPDPELTRLNTIPPFEPLLKASLNLVSGPRNQEWTEIMDHRSLLLMALRYQEHLHKLADAVSFDQNSLCVRIKEVAHIVQVLHSKLGEEQRRYQKSVEQLERVTEMVSTLAKVRASMEAIVPCMNRLNQVLPPTEQLEPCTLTNSTIQAS
ncbi:hypothetical protein ACOMHN_049851 [Nucella lapillus]